MEIDIPLLLTIVGVLLTAFSVYLVIKKKKYPGKLVLVKENSVGLFDEIASNFEEIKIEFNGAPIDKNIIYLKGSIINDGDIDLNIPTSEKPVGLELSSELKWIKSKITGCSRDVQCDSEIIDDSFLKFNCGILRINEYVQFEALVETNSNKKWLQTYLMN